MNTIFKSFFSLASLTLLSRLSGFVKVALFAYFYGRSPEADLFLAVMILPDLLYKFLSEGLITSAAIPIFVDLRNDKTERKRAFWSIFIILLIVSFLISVSLAIYSERICSFITPGFSHNQISTMSYLWDLICIYIFFGILSGFITAYLNAQNIFALPAIGPLLVNISIILGIFIANGKSVITIGNALITGSIIQFLWLSVLAYRNNINFNFSPYGFKFNFNVIKDFFSAILPVASWVFMLPFIPVYERYLLSMQEIGSVATLNYTEKLFNLPLGIISISAARVVFPALSKLKKNDCNTFLYKSLFSITLALVPVVIFIQLFSLNIVGIIFARGKFALADTQIAATLFKSYSLALLPLSLTMILNRKFFAEKLYKVPFLAGLTAIIIQFYLAGKLVEQKGIVGIGYAAFIAFSFQFAFLFTANYINSRKQERIEHKSIKAN